MGNIVPMRPRGGLSKVDKGRLQLFARGPGKHLNAIELNEAVDWCEVYGANPFANDIYFFVFDAKDPDKRRMVPVLSIKLYRKIASRTKNYRPDENPPVFTYDDKLIGPANPKGIVDCTVTIYQHSHGAWHPIRERIKWEERAPLVTKTWEGPRGNRKLVQLEQPILDPSKTNWHTMPETMLAKCVEAAAIRKGWPEETEGSYGEGELDAVHTIDLTASEIVETAEVEERQARLGGPSIAIDWMNGNPIDSVPVDQAFGKIMDFLKNSDKAAAAAWWHHNKAARQGLWERKPDEALHLKAEFERIERGNT